LARKEEKNNSPEKKYIGSMKSVSGGNIAAQNTGGSIKTLYSSSAGTKPTSGKNDAKGRSAGDYHYNPASGKYERGSSAGKSSVYEDKTEKIEKKWGKEFYSSGEDLRREEKPVSSLKSFYKPDWEPEPEADPFESSLYGQEEEDEDKVDVGQLIWGLGDQAANQIVGDALGAVDMFIGTPYQKVMDFTEKTFGLADRGENFISAYNKQFQEHAREEAEYYAQNASKGEIASLINQYGPDVLALLPDIALAFASGGTSVAAGAGMKGINLASKISKVDDVHDAMKVAARWVKNNPTVAKDFIQTSGNAFNQAMSEDATKREAFAYALTNGGIDAMISKYGVGGGNRGIESLPQGLRDAWKKVSNTVKSADAIAQEVAEGQIGGAMQRASRGIYDENAKVFSLRDENAVFNPKAMLESAVMDSISPAVMGGFDRRKGTPEPARAKVDKKVENSQETDKTKTENTGDKGNKRNTGKKNTNKEKQEEHDESVQKVLSGKVLNSKELKKLDMKDPKVQQLISEKSGMPITHFDNLDKATLRRKIQLSAMEIAKKNSQEKAAASKSSLEKKKEETYNKAKRR